MALPTGIRPRSAADRLALTRALTGAPRVVALTFPDDGWAAAHLRIAGRVPVWGCPGASPARAEGLLAKLGLPGLGHEPAGGTLDARLKLKRSAPVQAAPLPPVDGPLVTLLICTYNRAKLLPTSVASAMAQSWPCEIVVVDDGSTDGTAGVLEELSRDGGIRAFRQPENGGKPLALERGLAEARGEAVLVLDDDDMLMPGAVQVLARALFDNPELAAVCGDTIYLDKKGRVSRHYPASRVPGSAWVRDSLMRVPTTTGATLIRMSAHRAAGAYDPRLTRGEDLDMFTRLGRVGPVEALPFTTFAVRAHDGARGAAADRITTREKEAYNKRFLTIAGPVFRERWRETRAPEDRAEGHAWVVGLAQREMTVEAREEAARWPGPYTPTEVWARKQAGIHTPPARAGERLLVIDDGDPGALELTLERWAGLHSLYIDLEVHRDPLGAIQLHWDGVYAGQADLRTWLPSGPLHLRLSSDPGWCPPPLTDPRLFPPLPAPIAARCLAAAMGWAPPDEHRAGLTSAHPLLDRLRQCRAAMSRGATGDALAQLVPVLKVLPRWAPGWWLASILFEAMGNAAQAESCRSRGQQLAA